MTIRTEEQRPLLGVEPVSAPTQTTDQARREPAWRRAGAAAAGAWQRVPAHWRQALVLFAVSKAVLTAVGVFALQAFANSPGSPPPDDTLMFRDRLGVSSHTWYSMWFAWDSFQYRNLASTPLHEPWEHFGFPLLYPMLGKAVAVPLGGDTALALLLIAEVAYLVLLSYLYRWALLLTGDPATAARTTRYLVLLPTAFLFHAALTESLFVCLAVAAFYHAERRQWPLVGVLGFFLALSRSVGFLVALPLALLLLGQQDWRTPARAVRAAVRTGWPLLLFPAGWWTFMAAARWQTGDWLAYQHAQQRGWQIELQDPVRTIWIALIGPAPLDRTRVLIALAVLAVAVAGLRRPGPSYVVFALVMVLASMTIGPPVYKSLLRYALVAFPLAAVLAGWARHRGVDTALTAVLAVMQGAVFVLWLAYWTHTVI
ncbi:hypothetical protein Daura_18780 [Dactylosporangium aurantiacum]|uniref:Integral membrane protein n=1 Tax=Dactylosporangium aurantiacum TaxID=35754 RepID=A0A9Q9MMD9_9ACTN|nr:hypothetical protein [Dactylosporangium aurantiacum]MDG6105783.1 hypothetical protein [Dactylosporangium aurantiacum]UWZ58031.1 hypothetical protein Daura_18780 [Dactylosporangium aurantiacum]